MLQSSISWDLVYKFVVSLSPQLAYDGDKYIVLGANANSFLVAIMYNLLINYCSTTIDVVWKVESQKSKVWIQYNFNYNLGGLNGVQWIDYWVIVCHICGAIENCMMTLSINHVTHISLLCSLWLIKNLHSQPITTNY